MLELGFRMIHRKKWSTRVKQTRKAISILTAELSRKRTIAFLLVCILTIVFLFNSFEFMRSRNKPFSPMMIREPIIVDRLKSIDQTTYEFPDIPFFNETVIDFQERGKRIMAENNKMLLQPQIFVSLASFKDDSCHETLKAIFETAAIPERVFVGVVDQIDRVGSDDIPCEMILPLQYRKQVRLVRLPPLQGRGPTHARYIASKLWHGEKYFMMIDSHSGLRKRWDEELVEMMKDLPTAKSLLSHYPPEFTSLDNVEDPKEGIPWICSGTMDGAPAGLVMQSQDICSEANMSPQLGQCYSPYIGAGFMAGPAEMIIDAPFDRYLPMLFHGEELLIAARLWTRGWDIFTPKKSLVSHKYGSRKKNVFVSIKNWYEYIELSNARARAIMGTSSENEGPYPRDEIEELGVGSVRSIAAYLEFAGLKDLKAGKIESRCSQRFDHKSGKWISV